MVGILVDWLVFGWLVDLLVGWLGLLIRWYLSCLDGHLVS